MDPFMHALERRALFDITLLGDGTLEIVGTSSDDVVNFGFDVDLFGGDVEVTVELNGVESDFEEDEIEKIVCRLLGGDDQVNASGDDEFPSLPAPGIFRGGAGADTFEMRTDEEAVPVAILAGGGADVINATGALSGGGGADEINGGVRTDAISGGKGNDTITGGAFRDFILGNGGNDDITGGGGRDLIAGGAGADTITGGAKRDRIWGMDDNDDLFGNGGNDVIFGGLGTDNLDGGAGDNNLDQDEDPDIEAEIADIESQIESALDEFENA